MTLKRKPAGVADNEDRQAFTCRLPESLHDRIKAYRRVHDIPMQDMVTDAMEAYLAADPAGELARRTNPFHDCSPKEVEQLKSALELLRSEHGDPYGILKAVLNNWRRLAGRVAV